ncbi:hypothetical protein V8B97DRAFT_36810 [Scleroderma yunnanense]
MSEEPYISRKTVDSSYRPRSYQMSPGLLRAREPFRVKNAITGLILAGFGVGVWAYSIRAVKQEDFSDVDEEAKEMIRGRGTVGTVRAGAPDVGATVVPGMVPSAVNVSNPVALSGALSSSTERVVPPSKPRGVLAPILDRIFPRLLDPTHKTLVWGAPPADNIGRMRLRGSTAEH